MAKTCILGAFAYNTQPQQFGFKQSCFYVALGTLLKNKVLTVD